MISRKKVKVLYVQTTKRMNANKGGGSGCALQLQVHTQIFMLKMVATLDTNSRRICGHFCLVFLLIFSNEKHQAKWTTSDARKIALY